MLDKGKDQGDKQESAEAKPAPELQRGAVIGDTGNQARWNRAQQAHYLDQDESATELFRKNGEAPVGICKFGIDGLGDEQADLIAWKPEEFFAGAQKNVKGVAKDVFCQDKSHEDAKMHYIEDFNAFYTTNLTKH